MARGLRERLTDGVVLGDGGYLLELEKRRKRWGVASACIGGGQGIAVIVERAA